MNTMMKCFATLLVCLWATMGIADPGPDITVRDAGQKSFALYIDDAESGFVHIGLKDANGIVLLTDRVKNQNAFARKYNLVNLPPGEYVLFVEDGAKTIAQPIIINNDALEIPENRMTKIFAPAILVNHTKLDYTMLCLDETAVTIRIIDEFGRENYASTSLEKGSVHRRFDISALEPGKYTIVTSLDGQNFDKVYTEVFTLGQDVAGN